MGYNIEEPRKNITLHQHIRFPLKLMIEYERNTAYFYVEYRGHKIGMIQEKIGRAQSFYNNILQVLKLEMPDKRGKQ